MPTVLQQVLTSLAIVGLAISAIISYLKVNKLWARRHIKEVAESISVVAAILSLFTTLPFLIKFVVIDHDYVAAGKFLLSLLVHAGKLIKAGISPVTACHTSIAQALTDDSEMLAAINELSASVF